MDPKLIAVAAAALVLLALFPPAPVSGQAVATSCTASLIATFTPCLSYITNSTTDGGASPTANCCQCLGTLVNASLSCTCLILTGHVPLRLPINLTLALMLPKACNSTFVPLQCKDTSAQLPAPGPVAVAPAMAPLAPMTPESPAPTPEPTVATPAPTPEPTVGTPAPAPEPIVATPAPAPEPTVATPATTPEPTVGTPAPAPEPIVATPAPAPEPTVATPASSPSPAQTRPQVVPNSAWRGSAGVSVLFAVAGTMLF